MQPETEVVASVTYQSLFRRFRKLSSMSGTALSEAVELSDGQIVSQRDDLPRAARVQCPQGLGGARRRGVD